MNILITGANGQLGKSLKGLALSYPEHHFTYTDIEELDICNFEQIKEHCSKFKYDVLINCAAYTAVDKAEEDKDKAYLLNAKAPGYLARISKIFNIFLIQISTDFVFDGKGNKPYTEKDMPNPLSVYGETKAEGENQVENNAGNAIILRTSWLYSQFGTNFMKTILRIAKEKDSLNIVADQIGTPTYASDLALCILTILPKIKQIEGVEILNYSNMGETTWYGFAKAIAQTRKIPCKIKPITTAEYPLPATRPAYSVLNKEKIISKFDIEIPEWIESLKICLADYNQASST